MPLGWARESCALATAGPFLRLSAWLGQSPVLGFRAGNLLPPIHILHFFKLITGRSAFYLERFFRALNSGAYGASRELSSSGVTSQILRSLK